MLNWKCAGLSSLTLFGFAATISGGQCPSSTVTNIVMRVDNGSAGTDPLREQVMQVGDTVYWYTAGGYPNSFAYVVFDQKEGSPCALTSQPGHPSNPATGTCTIAPLPPTTTTAQTFRYAYCPSNSSINPEDSVNCGTQKKYHHILVQPPGAAFNGDANLELDGKEVNHFVQDAATCIVWQDANGYPAPVSFKKKNKPASCTPAASGGVTSCLIPFANSRPAKDDDYNICAQGAACTDPTIHILDSNGNPLALHSSENPIALLIAKIAFFLLSFGMTVVFQFHPSIHPKQTRRREG